MTRSFKVKSFMLNLMSRGFMPFSVGKILVCLAFLVCPAMLTAQTINWNSHNIEDVTCAADPENGDFAKLPNNKIVALYNVKTGKFFSCNGLYGTQCILSDMASVMYITDTSYTLAKNGQHYSGKKLRGQGVASQNGNGDFIGFFSWENSAYVDRPENEPASTWTFTPTGNGDYTVSVINTYLDGWPPEHQANGQDHQRYYMQGNDNGSITFSTTTSDYSVWRIVTRTDVEAEFAKRSAVADGQNPVDASMFLFDPDFLKNNRYTIQWQPNTWDHYTYTTYNQWKWEPASASDHVSVGIGEYTDKKVGDNVYYYTKPYGRYCTAQINGNGKLSQTITSGSSGWFRLSVEGWRNNTDASLFAYTTLNGVQTPVQTVALSNTPTTYNYHSKQEASIPIGNTPDWYPLIYGITFDNTDTYRKSFDIYIPEGATFTYGVQATNAQAGATTIFDNFKLEYLGHSILYLDEDAADVQYMIDEKNDNAAAYKAVNRIYLHRTMTKGQWNGIVLPVNMTGHQLMKAFGHDVKLAVCRGTTELNTRVTFETVNVSDDATQVFKAYELYLIKPSADAYQTATSYITTKGQTVNVAAPYYIIEDIDLDDTQLGSGNIDRLSTSTYGVQKGDGVTYLGTLIKKPGALGQGSYVFTSDGNLTRLNTNHTVYGFRCWIVDNSPAGGAKQFTDLVSIDGSSTTGIEGVYTTAPVSADEPVFTLTGVRAGTMATAGSLPAGIYVVKGKKFIIK